MSTHDFQPWRSPSPLGGQRPSKADLEEAKAADQLREDVLPLPQLEANRGLLRLLIVGINPSPWTIAVNAPFAHPGNRFWPSLAAGGVLPKIVDATVGLLPSDEALLAERGVGITNLVSRPTSRASQLTAEEFRRGAQTLVERVHILRPQVVAVLGITAFRKAFCAPKAQIGQQDTAGIIDWPVESDLWVLPNPSGLNAHETTESLGKKWRKVWGTTRVETARS